MQTAADFVSNLTNPQKIQKGNVLKDPRLQGGRNWVKGTLPETNS